MFPDERHAAPDAAEAEQRAAVAALHRVAGDRQLQLLLPPQYREMWEEIKASEAKRSEATAARAARDAERRERDRERRARIALRGPTAVTMSSEKQAMLQALLREGYSSAPRSSEAPPLDPELLRRVEEKLLPMGFGQSQVRQAAEAVAGRARASASDSVADSAADLALDWLFIHLPSEQLPRQFRATKSSVTVIKRNNAPSSAAAAKEEEDDGSDASHAAQSFQGSEGRANSVRRLGAFGYAPSECLRALEASGGDETAALQALFEQLTGVAADVTGARGRPDEVAAGCWEEEMMVLEAIYGADACAPIGQGRDGVRVGLPLPEGSLLAALAEAASSSSPSSRGEPEGEEERPTLSLDFFRPRGGATEEDAGYPCVPPLIAASCSSLPAACLRRLTRRLARLAVDAAAVGQPMLHDLVTAASEMAAGEWHLQPGQPPRLPLEDSSGDEREDGEGQNFNEGMESGDAEARSEEEEEMEEVEEEEVVEAETQAAASDLLRQHQELEGGKDPVAVSVGLSGQEDDTLEEETPSFVEEFDGLALGGDDAPQADTQQPEKQKDPKPGGQQRRQARPALSAAAAEAECRKLAAHQAWLQGSAEHAGMRQARAALPAADKRGELLRLISSCATVVISGATGCGKSTQVLFCCFLVDVRRSIQPHISTLAHPPPPFQVPQYILEEAIAGGRGAECNIVVTQPRRISALGLAARVADERGEDVGETVGYSVRLDTKQSARTRLLFCTTGGCIIPASFQSSLCARSPLLYLVLRLSFLPCPRCAAQAPPV